LGRRRLGRTRPENIGASFSWAGDEPGGVPTERKRSGEEKARQDPPK
jgi:hypothetical protein